MFLFREGRWVEEYPPLPLHWPSEEVEHPFNKFMEAAPEDIVKAVKPYQCSHFAMLYLCRQSDAALAELYKSPTMFWLLAPYLATRSISHEGGVHALVHEGLDCFFESVFGRNEPWLLQRIRELPPHDYSPWRMTCRDALEKLLRTPEAMELLNASPSCSWHLLTLVAKYLPWSLNPLARDALANNEDLAHILGIFRDAAEMADLLGYDSKKPLMDCTTYEQLLALHNEWQDCLVRRTARE